MPEPETPQNCPHCGARLEPDESFCPECGAKFGQGVEIQQKPSKQMTVVSPEALQKSVSQLKDYVAECQAKGVPEGVAKAELIRAGWSKKIVNAAVPATQKKETPNPSKDQPLAIPRVPYLSEDSVKPLLAQLESHVKHLRKQGMSDDAIRDKLLKCDICPNVLVDNILPPPGTRRPQATLTTKPPRKLGGKMGIILILLGVGVIFIWGDIFKGSILILLGMFLAWPNLFWILLGLIVVGFLINIILGSYFLEKIGGFMV